MNEPPPTPESLLPDVCSESAALRVLNLPTSRRDWLRERLAGQPCGNGTIYAATAVLNLGRQLAADPSILNPAPTPRAVPAGLQHGAPTRGGQPQLANRVGPQLEVR
jgi:hypothetical protein